jgi:hypothetical protein
MIEDLDLSSVTVYVPAATGSVEEFVEEWHNEIGIQAIPVNRVWARDGKEMALGVAIRMGVHEVRGR